MQDDLETQDLEDKQHGFDTHLSIAVMVLSVATLALLFLWNKASNRVEELEQQFAELNVYVVSEGDTLPKIGKKVDVDWKVIAELNKSQLQRAYDAACPEGTETKRKTCASYEIPNKGGQYIEYNYASFPQVGMTLVLPRKPKDEKPKEAPPAAPAEPAPEQPAAEP